MGYLFVLNAGAKSLGGCVIQHTNALNAAGKLQYWQEQYFNTWVFT
jgi:hypothetical protein